MDDRILVVMALPEESQGLFERQRVPVLFTGVGKVNAAYALTRALARRPASLVVNFGTAGSSTFARGTLVGCHRFVQRDMDVTGLGFAAGQTPFETMPAAIEHAAVWEDLPQGVCGSADRFETIPGGVSCDVVDMEAYALAKVCALESTPFACAKFVTDGADSAAAGDWQANLPRAAEAFWAAYMRLRLARMD